MVPKRPGKQDRELKFHRLKITKAKVDYLMSSKLAADVPASVTENILKPIWSGKIKEITVIYEELIEDLKVSKEKTLWWEWFLV